MTVRELYALEGVSLCYFDGSGWHSSGFFNTALKVLALDINLSEKDKKQVALHELGHKDHTRSEYQNARLRCENEADRNMIHHLVKDALDNIEDPREFDYIQFMSYYNLRTITNEIMVREEYLALVE